MNIKEFRKKITELNNTEWFNALEVNLNYDHINFNTTLKGITSMYEFALKQNSEWSKRGENIPPELLTSKTFFNSIPVDLTSLSDQDEYSKVQVWNVLKTKFESPYVKYFLAESPEVEFLIKMYRELPQAYPAAYNFIADTISNPFGTKDNIAGTLLACEFTLKDHTDIAERKNSEKASISKIRNQFYEYLNQTETETIEHLKNVHEKSKDYTKDLDEIKSEKEKIFNDWFTQAQEKNNAFNEESNNKVENLEQAFDELLKLKKPAEYWNKRAGVLKGEGHSFLRWLIGLVAFGCLTLYFLLWLTPGGMLLSFIKGETGAIKWSIVYVTFISFLAFGIKVLAKVVFSSFHLARDAEEREQLTYVYLAMIKDSAVDEKDKSLIMQSLFSRADTGLLKEDSSPTMPGLFEKLVQK